MITVLQYFLFEGVAPEIALSDEDDISETRYEDEQSEKWVKESPLQIQNCEQQTDKSHLSSEQTKTKCMQQSKEFQGSGISQNTSSRSEGRRSRSGKKGKKRPAHRRSQQKSDDVSAVESTNNCTSHHGDDTAVSGRDQVLSSSSRFASPEDPKSKQMCPFEPMMESKSEKPMALSTELKTESPDELKDGFILALHSRGNPGFPVARQRVPGGGWILDTITYVTKRDPAAQFAVALKARKYLDCGLFLLVVNCCRLTENWNSYLQVIVSLCGRAGGWRVQFWTNASLSIAETHWPYQYCLSCQNWTQKTVLDTYLLMFSCGQTAMCNQQRFCVLFYNNAVLDVSFEILAALNEDGVTRWLD
ncbi:unnamed protein product [Musa hybrid cultivar]